MLLPLHEETMLVVALIETYSAVDVDVNVDDATLVAATT